MFSNKNCVPCQGGIPPLDKNQILRYNKLISDDWFVVDEKKLVKNFVFNTFNQAMLFANKTAKLANSEGHHPYIHINFKIVKIGSGDSATYELQTNKQLDFETLDTDEDGEYSKMYEIYGVDKQSKKSNIMRVYITVNDVNEVPANFVDYVVHVDENEAKMSACLETDDTLCLPNEVIAGSGGSTPLDLDRDQALKYYFDGTSANTDVFSIEEDSGLIKTINALDFESKCKKLTSNDTLLLWVLTRLLLLLCPLSSLACSSFFFLQTVHTCTIFYSSHC